MKLVLSFLTILSCSISFAATPLKHTCKSKSGEVVRTIEVVYPTGEGKPKCETKYTKENNQEKVLYSAMNEEDFCEKKAQEFIESRLTDWTCTKE